MCDGGTGTGPVPRSNGDRSLHSFLRPGVRVTLSHSITGRFIGWKNSTTLRVFIDGDPVEVTFHASWLEAVNV